VRVVVTGELGEGTGNTICTVHLWFLLVSALPLLLSSVHLPVRATLNAKQKNEHAGDIPAYVIVIKDRLTHSLC
jgi:hypothetical protein